MSVVSNRMRPLSCADTTRVAPLPHGARGYDKLVEDMLNGKDVTDEEKQGMKRKVSRRLALPISLCQADWRG